MIIKRAGVLAGSILLVAVVAALADEGAAPNRGLHAQMLLKTSLGPIVIELDGESAPRTASQFARYVEDGYYDKTIFHRVLAGGLIQGGAFTASMDRKTKGLRDQVVHERDNGLENKRGTVAIYRTAGLVDSANAEFFINVGDNPVLDRRHLDGAAYTVFGKVVEGMETVDRIAESPVSTHPKYARGRTKVVPVKPVIIESTKALSAFDYKAARLQAESADRARRELAQNASSVKAQAVEARIAEFEKKYGTKVTTTPSGLKYLTIRPGSGAPPIGSETVSIHCVGTLASGFEFENTYTNPNSAPVKKVVSKFIEGLREGLVAMHEGEKRLYVVPPELGFKEVGVPGKIPPNATLFFEIELLAIENEG